MMSPSCLGHFWIISEKSIFDIFFAFCACHFSVFGPGPQDQQIFFEYRAYPFLCALFSPILRYWKLFRLTVPEHCACDGDSLHMSPTQWFSTT